MQGSVNQEMRELLERLRRIEQRVAALELRQSIPAKPGPAPREVPARDRPSLSPSIPLVGRTLVVLGGAFALRAVTDAGALPHSAGTLLALGYALLWLVFADRATAAGRHWSAWFHGVASAAVAFPLVWEATTRFGVLSPAASAGVLGFLAALSLALAGRHGFLGLAWIFLASTCVVAPGLGFVTQDLASFLVVLLALGLATLWLGYARGWKPLAEFMTIVVDVVLALLALLAWEPRAAEKFQLGEWHMVPLQLTFAAGHAGIITLWVLRRGRDVRVPEMVQTVVAFLLGIGGAVVAARTMHFSPTLLGVGSLVLAASSYVVSFAFVDRRAGKRRAFLLYTSVALALMLVSLFLVLRGPALAYALAGAGLVTSWLGGLRRRATLSLHGAVYATAAALASGLLFLSWRSFSGPGVGLADWAEAPALVSLATILIASTFAPETASRNLGPVAPVPRLVLVLLLLLGAGGLLVTTLGTGLGRLSGLAGEPGVVAALRTAVLGLAALLFASLGGSGRLRQADWLVFPLLVVTGIKLLVEDVRVGGAGTLFVSFAVYGSSLILAPWLRKRRRRTEDVSRGNPPLAPGQAQGHEI